MDTAFDAIGRTFSTVLFGLDVLAIVLLVVSLLLKRGQILDGVRTLPRRPIAVVIGVLLLAVVLGLMFDVPDPLPWLTAGWLLVVVLNRLLDTTFWRGLVTMLGVFTVFGALLSIALGLTVIGENGWAFYGVTRLTEMGGPDLNPEYSLWWIPLLVTTFLKFAVPMALTVTLA